MRNPSPWHRLVALVIVLVCPVVLSGPVLATSGAVLRFQPAFAQARPGETVRLEVRVAEVTDLSRLEFTATYDPGALEPLDADPGRVGVQLEIGPVFADGYVPENEASGGVMRFVAGRAPGDGPFSGEGVVAAVTFRVREGAAPGSYPLHFDPAAVRLLDPDGHTLPLAELSDGTIRVSSVTTAIQGWVTREGTSDYSRTAVTAFFYAAGSSPPYNWARACTDSHGDFLLLVPDGEGTIPPGVTLPDGGPPSAPYEWAFVRLEFPNYLSECYWEPLDDEVVNIGWHTLEGGDVNEDGCVNIYDIVRIIADFGASVPAPCFVPYEPCPGAGPGGQIAPASDVNGDCWVNIFDLTMTAENFGLCSNCH